MSVVVEAAGPSGEFDGVMDTGAPIFIGNCSGEEFGREDLEFHEFRHATIKRAVFHDTRIEHAIFRQVEAEGVQFRNASLSNAEIYASNFERSIFENTDVTHAKFIEVNFDGSRFEADTDAERHELLEGTEWLDCICEDGEPSVHKPEGCFSDVSSNDK